MRITIDLNSGDAAFGAVMDALARFAGEKSVTVSETSDKGSPEKPDIYAGAAQGSGEPKIGTLHVNAPRQATAAFNTPAAPPVAFTEEDVAAATRTLATTKGIDVATNLLKEFAVEKAREIPAEKRESYIERTKSLLGT